MDSTTSTPSYHSLHSKNSSSSHRAKHGGETADSSPSSLTLRPNVHTANTIIPILEPPATSKGLRVRSHTSPERQSSASSTSLTNRRRAGTNLQSQQPPPQLDLGTIASRSSLQEPLPPLTEPVPERPSEPIPIPPRKQNRGPFSPTGTPLTARAPSGNYFPPLSQFTNPRPRISQSLTPSYSRASTTRMPQGQSGPSVQRGFAPMDARAKSPLYTPTSPLSPTAPSQTLSPSNRRKERRPGQSLNLAGLPRFHPANFPPIDSNPTSSSSRNPRANTSQPRPGRGSDAQQKLHQYQRDLVTNAGKYAKPSPPRLTPLRSPGEPMTPLALEGQGDYLRAGSSSGSGSSSSKEDGREMVERLVRRENERRKHPEARSGSVSPALSPALSPAVSPAV